jgi:hypothetical protein
MRTYTRNAYEFKMNRDKKEEKMGGSKVTIMNSVTQVTKTFSYSRSQNGETIVIGLLNPLAGHTKNAKTLP